MKKIIAIIGARPQFIKHFPIEFAAKGKINLQTIHTGQHYDTAMSQVFFDELGMKQPDFMLSIGSGNHGAQTGAMMASIEQVVLDEKPDALLVYGDTNSTLAGAVVASKLHIPLIHVEAGLRSHNKRMPEEVNRILTDHISDYLFVTSEKALINLKSENITENVFNVGDVMKDLVTFSMVNKWLRDINIDKQFVYATIHRPYNTDDKDRLLLILKAFNNLDKLVVFPIHPRTRNLMKVFNIDQVSYNNIKFLEPQGYFDNLSYLNKASSLVTDSGGMQKEAYWLKKKCVTIRTETEWVETLENGWNILMFDDLANLQQELNTVPETYLELYGNDIASEKIIDMIK